MSPHSVLDPRWRRPPASAKSTPMEVECEENRLEVEREHEEKCLEVECKMKHELGLR